MRIKEALEFKCRQFGNIDSKYLEWREVRSFHKERKVRLSGKTMILFLEDNNIANNIT
jgi:hypothetical protein